MVKFKGQPLTLSGTEVKVGQQAPDFTVTNPDLKPVSLKDFKGKVLFISSVPSLDTSVCSLQSKRFDTEAHKHPEAQFITISMDLPFAQARFAKESSCHTMPLYSDYQTRSFATQYGLLIAELKLIARAIHIIDKDGKIVYRDIVDEMTNEPDYDKALNALKALSP